MTWLILDLCTQYFDFCVRLICGVLRALHFMHITESVFQGVSYQPAIWRLTLTLKSVGQVLIGWGISGPCYMYTLFSTTGNALFLFFQMMMMVLLFLNIAKIVTWVLWINVNSGLLFSSIETYALPRSIEDPSTDPGPQAIKPFYFIFG